MVYHRKRKDKYLLQRSRQRITTTYNCIIALILRYSKDFPKDFTISLDIVRNTHTYIYIYIYICYNIKFVDISINVIYI